MKRITVLIACLIMVYSMMFTSFAELDEGTELVMDMLKYYQYETDQIVLAVTEQYTEWEKYLGDNIDDITFSLMYQVYYLKMKDIVAAYDTDGSFRANISDKYYWVVPNYEMGSEVQVVRNDQTRYGWAIRRGTKYMSWISLNYPEVGFGIAMIYDNILKAYPEADKLSFRLVYDEENSMHIMSFTCDGEEYVVPYFASKDITWLTNGNIYTASEFIGIVRDGRVEDGSMEIYDNNPAPETIYSVYNIVGTVVAVCVAVVAVIAANKMKKKKN